jgi:hypothetical protein
MAGEEKILNKDLAEVLREMSKAPGGNVAQPRPVTPGPILGGPKPETPKLGKVDPLTGVRTKRDPAIELFRFYAYGEDKPTVIPPAPPDTKQVTVTQQELPTEEKFKRKAAKQAGKKVTVTEERKAINKGVREGTIGGMKRAPGSKPPIHILEAEAAAKRERQAENAKIIRDALEKAFGARGAESPEFQGRFTPELGINPRLSREEQKYLDILQRRIQDIIADREAAVAEELAARGDMTSAFEDYKAMQQAERRTLEGRQAAERARISRQKTETSFRDLPEKFLGGKGGAALGALDIVSGAVGAYSTYKQMTEELARRKETETLN